MIDNTIKRTRDEFISLIQQEISVACALPFSIPVKEIERITDLSAEWFFRHVEDAVEERYFIIPSTVFSTDRFKQTRTINLPKCIYSIFTLKKLREDFGRSFSFDGTADFGIERLFLSDAISIGQGTENMMYYVLNMSWLDLSSHIINHTISFNYNRNSNKLFISGKTPDRDCVAHCYVKLPIEDLMMDEIFYRYVVSNCKIQLARILGTFEFNLPGGIRINYDLIKSEGTDELEKIKDEIKQDEAMDFFFTSGGA